jgi:hypothetical protein
MGIAHKILNTINIPNRSFFIDSRYRSSKILKDRSCKLGSLKGWRGGCRWTVGRCIFCPSPPISLLKNSEIIDWLIFTCWRLRISRTKPAFSFATNRTIKLQGLKSLIKIIGYGDIISSIKCQTPCFIIKLFPWARWRFVYLINKELSSTR